MIDLSLLENLAVTFGFLIGAIIVSEIFLFVLEKIIQPLTTKTKTTLDDRLINSIKTPVRLLGIILGAYFTIKPIYPNYLVLGHNSDFWLVTLLILWVAILISNLINAIILWYYKDLTADSTLKNKIGISHDFAPMLSRILKILIYTIGIIIVLDRFGIEITPLITALGIGGLAVALALKDTLANFFAGLYLLSDKPIKIGEYISIDSEQSPIKGFVEEVGWRTTRIRTRGNFTYFIPNEKITLNNIVNYSRGEGNNWKGANVSIGVDYNCNVKKVKQTLTNAVKKVQEKSEFIDKSFEPFVRINEFADSAIMFKVFYRVNNFFESEDAATEIREQIIEDFRKAKINIPYPTRTVKIQKR